MQKLKTLFLIFLLAFYSFQVVADIDTLEGQATSGLSKWEGQTVAGGWSWSCTDADLICQSAEGSGYDNSESWGSNEDLEDGTIDEDSTNTRPCGGASNTQVVALANTETDVTYHPYTYEDMGSAQSTIYFQGYFNVKTFSSTTNDRTLQIYSANTSSAGLESSPAFRIEADSETGGASYRLQLYHYSNVPAHETDESGSTMSYGTWYGVRVYYNANQSSGGISWGIDYNLDGSFTSQSVSDDGTSTRQPQYIYMGCGPSLAAETGTADLDLLKVDSTAYAAASCE